MANKPKRRAPLGNRRYAANAHPDARSTARKKLIIAVHAACRRLGIDEDDRKAMQYNRTGKRSMADMTVGELAAMLDHLNRNWAKPASARPALGKVRALWWSLYWLGAIHLPDDEALTVFVTRQTGLSHLRFLDHRQAPSVIEALKSWLERTGVFWWSAQDIADARAGPDGDVYADNADRHAVLAAIGRALHQADGIGTADITLHALCFIERPDATLRNLTGQELDACIRHFGKGLRRWIERAESL